MRIDPRIKLISHEENRGLGGARNTGIRFAGGNILLSWIVTTNLTQQPLINVMMQ